MRVHIVADLDVVDAPEGFNAYAVADALAQTLGGETGSFEFVAEMVGPNDTDVRGRFRLVALGGHAGEWTEADHMMWPVDTLHNGTDGYLPVRRDG